MEPDRGHPQLGRGESGCLQQMGWGCLRSPRNEGAVPRPAQPTNQVLGRTFESVSIPSSVARLRPTSPTALPDVSGLRRAKRSWAAWKPTAWKTGGSATATPSVAAGSAELDRRLSTTLRPYGHLNCCDFRFRAGETNRRGGARAVQGAPRGAPWSFYIFHATAAWVRPRSLTLTSRCLVNSG